MEDNRKSRLLPSIFEYLNTYDKEKILPNNLNYIIDKVSESAEIPKEISEEIIKLFFREIKNQTLQGYIIILRRFGKFFISSPKLTKNNIRVFFKFEPSKSLLEKINQNE